MDKIERVKRIFDGRRVDRAPATLFYHFGQQHNPGSVHAQLELAFYKRFDVDLLKVMNDYSYSTPNTIGDRGVTSPEQLYTFKPLRVEESSYREQLIAMRMITSELGEEVACWDTVFNPWFTIRRNILRADIDCYMQHHRQELMYLLEVVTESLIEYVKMSLGIGASGVFYSVPASPD